jgi:PEP-CTERM motif
MKKRLITLVAAMWLGNGLVRGAEIIPPACSSLGTLQGLIDSQACTAGVFTIKDPSFSGPSGVTASSITLSVLSGIDSVSLAFGGGVFNSPIGGSSSFTFGYTIDPPPDIIKGVSAEVEDAGQDSFGPQGFMPSAVGDAIAVQYLLCVGAGFVDGDCATSLDGFLLSLPDADNNDFLLAATLSGGVTFSSPVNTVGVRIFVDLTNGGNFSGISSAFPLDVPEPGSLALFGLGAVALASRRFRSLRRA